MQHGAQDSRPSWWRGAAWIAVVAVAYVLAARLGLSLARPGQWLSPFWPASGLLLALLILSPPRGWPALTAAIGLATIAAHAGMGTPLAVSLALGLASCLEGIIGALLIARLRPGAPTMGSLRDVILLLAAGVIGVGALAALLVAATGAVAAGLPFWRTWLIWWSADGLGMLVIASCILAWAAPDAEGHGPTTRAQVAELTLALAVLAGVTSVTVGLLPLGPNGPTPYLTFPVLLWVAVRFGPRGASLATLILTGLATWATVAGRGRFADPTSEPGWEVLEMQVFLLVEGLSALALAALTSERRRATLALEQARASLEAGVVARTAALLDANSRLVREVTERAATEAALRESQARLARALHLARSFAFEWDRASDLVLRSADCGEILGLAGDEATRDTGQGFFARVHPDDRPALVGAATGCTPEAPTYSLRYRVIRPDGGVVALEEAAQAIFDAEGRHVRLVGFSSDVTAQERAAQRAGRLQAITAGLSAARTPEQVAAVVVGHGLDAIEAAAGTIFVLAGDQLQIIGSAGYTPEQVRGWERVPLGDGTPATDAIKAGVPIWLESREAMAARYGRLALPATQNNAFAALPLRADGHSLGVLAISFRQPRSFSDEDRGYMLTLAGLCAQALERARLFVAEQEAHAQAEAAVQLRDQFLSIAAHELRTPLTLLLGTAQLVQRRAARGKPLTERDERGLATIAGQARRLDRLITMLLDISRIERGQLSLDCRSLDLRALLERLANEVQPTLAHHRVVFRAPAGALTIHGDELRLEQVFQNLIHNAVKYSPEGGEVLVEADAADGRAVVHVRDRGIGIPAAELPSLFTRFFRASNGRERQIAGMGIGLYVAREIVERHGGTISAFSVEGRGSTFTVQLPLG